MFFMKKVFSYSHFFLSVFFLCLTSCGSDNALSGKGASGQNSLGAGGSCACASSYSPVCGANDITYDNLCIANCFGVTQTSQGNCICSELPVCGDNGVTYTECEAQAAIRNGRINRIVKFSDCRSTAPSF